MTSILENLRSTPQDPLLDSKVPDTPIEEIGDGRKANVGMWAHVHALSGK